MTITISLGNVADGSADTPTAARSPVANFLQTLGMMQTLSNPRFSGFAQERQQIEQAAELIQAMIAMVMLGRLLQAFGIDTTASGGGGGGGYGGGYGRGRGAGSVDGLLGDSGPGGEIGGVTVDGLFKAIVQQETGGRNVLNQTCGSGATGIGQVMPANIGPWSAEAARAGVIPRSVTYREFRDNPGLQTKIIRFKLGQYLREANQRGYSGREAIRYVAAKWYSGQGQLKDSTRPQKGGPSIAAYANNVLSHYSRLA